MAPSPARPSLAWHMASASGCGPCVSCFRVFLSIAAEGAGQIDVWVRVAAFEFSVGCSLFGGGGVKAWQSPGPRTSVSGRQVQQKTLLPSGDSS